MKKSTIALILTLTIISALSQASMVKAENNNSAPIFQVISTSSTSIQGITTNKLKPYVLNEQEIQSVLGNFSDEIEKLKFQNGYYVFNNEKYGIKDSNVYVMISLGQRNTTGYGIKVISTEDIEGTSSVIIQETKPEPGTMVGQIVTFPYIIVKFAQGTPNVRVVTDTGRELYPLVDSSELIEKNWNDLKSWTEVPEDKGWLVTFKKNISKAEINSDTIYVRDSNGIKIRVGLIIGEDQKTIKVVPIEKYVKGQTYYLFISDNMNSQKHLSNKYNGYRMMFTIKSDGNPVKQ